MTDAADYLRNMQRRAEVGVLDYHGLTTRELELFWNRLDPGQRMGPIGEAINAELKARCNVHPDLVDLFWPLEPKEPEA